VHNIGLCVTPFYSSYLCNALPSFSSLHIEGLGLLVVVGQLLPGRHSAHLPTPLAPLAGSDQVVFLAGQLRLADPGSDPLAHLDFARFADDLARLPPPLVELGSDSLFQFAVSVFQFLLGSDRLVHLPDPPRRRHHHHPSVDIFVQRVHFAVLEEQAHRAGLERHFSLEAVEFPL